MKSYNTTNLDKRELERLNPNEQAWLYNGLDCCVTFEIIEKLRAEMADEEPCVQRTYADSLAKLGPTIDMQLRGIKVDIEARDTVLSILEKRLAQLDSRFQRIVREAFGYEYLNWNSPLQVKMLFYSTLNLPEIKKRNSKGIYAATVDEDALNKLSLNFYAEPLCNYILAMREIQKKLELLRTQIDDDGRIRTSFNVAGTNTGRLSSSESAFGSGRNLQNIDKELRYPFISDNSMILVNVDLEQSDARNVGARIWELFVDTHGPASAGRYLDACESGDLHTSVARMVWNDLGWGVTLTESGEPLSDREVAEQPYYRQMSYRDTSKRLGHGTNFLGQPPTMAKHTHTPKNIIEAFQKSYFEAFPLIPEWHAWVIEQIKTVGVLTTLYGRRRHFFGRGNDAATHREAVAFEPQSMTGHAIDMGYLQLWRSNIPVQLLVQVHDSILFQVRFSNHEEVINEALEVMRFKTTLAQGRVFEVPLEAKVGWNWGNQKTKKGKVVGNTYGLRKWKGKAVEQLPPPAKRLKDYL